MTVASQAITATDDTPRASDCCGRRPARFPEIFPGIQMSPSLPGKFRNRLVNSRLTGRSSNRTTVSKREESQVKECQESYANTAHPRKRAKFPSLTARNDLSRSIVECRSPCPERIGPDIAMSRDGPGRRCKGRERSGALFRNVLVGVVGHHHGRDDRHDGAEQDVDRNHIAGAE